MCIIFGCSKFGRRVGTPSGEHKPPSQILCMRCGSHTSAAYRKESLWFSLFFVPVIPLRCYSPYLVCSTCKSPLSTMGGLVECEGCKVHVSSLCTHCPQCGVVLSHGRRV